MKPTKSIKGNQQNPTSTSPPDSLGSLQEYVYVRPKYTTGYSPAAGSDTR
ncbi:hypothetical protein P9G84_25275 [Brevibacillus centrosporus]|nr:hypothetical protein [Brevibacillus centrosporus]MEC2132224.1 hypothetical protein [Brevibacillus centrosporus]